MECRRALRKETAILSGCLGGEAMIRQGRAYCIMDSDYYEGVKNNGIYAFLGNPEEWVAGAEADYYRTTPENADAHLQAAIPFMLPGARSAAWNGVQAFEF